MEPNLITTFIQWVMSLIALYPYAALAILFVVFLAGMFNTTSHNGIVDNSYRSGYRGK